MLMSKTRLNRKEVKRRRQKHAFDVATQVRILAESLASQQQLDTVLNQEPDMDKRIKLFDFMKPFIKRFIPQRPSLIEKPPGIILKP